MARKSSRQRHRHVGTPLYARLVTAWLAWFLDAPYRAVENAQGTLDSVLAKHASGGAGSYAQGGRSNCSLNRLLDGFEGKLASRKWAASIAKCSPDTALRHINELVARGVQRKSGAGGRSTAYELTE